MNFYNYIRNIFNFFIKKPPKWYEFTIRHEYDISWYPELSDNSPIKLMTVINRYRYCPDNNKVERRAFNSDRWFVYGNYTENKDVLSETKRIYDQHKRDKKLNKILK